MASRVPVKIGEIKLKDFTSLAGSVMMYIAFSLFTGSIVGIVAYNGYVLGTYTGEGRGQMFYWIIWNAVALSLIYVTIAYGTFQVMSSSRPIDVLRLMKRYAAQLVSSGFMCVMAGLIAGTGLATLYMDSDSFNDNQKIGVAYVTIIVSVAGSVFSSIRSYEKYGGRSPQDVYEYAVGRIDISAAGRTWDRVIASIGRLHIAQFVGAGYVIVIGIAFGAYFSALSEQFTGIIIPFVITLTNIAFLVTLKVIDIVFRRGKLVGGEHYSPRGIELFDEPTDEDCLGDVTSFNLERKAYLRAKQKARASAAL